MSPPASRIREALLAPIEELDRWPLALICAPGGYGKTTLLEAWRERLRGDGRAVAWLSLSSLHGDPGLFVEDLVDAIRDGLGETRAGDGEGDGFGTELLRRLAPLASEALPPDRAPAVGQQLARLLERSVRDLGEPLVLILDDYHCLPRGCVADALVEALLREPVTGRIRLLVASRGDPPPAAARLVASGRACEIGPADLSLRADQVAEILCARPGDAGLAADEIVPLVLAQTGGWAMGVRLAARALARRLDEDPRRVVAALGQGDRVFASLAEDLLDQERADAVRLLESAALLGPVPAETLIAATTGVREPEAVLRDVLEKGLARRSDERIGLHPLWRELLMERMRRQVTADEFGVRARPCVRLLEQIGEAPRAAELCFDLGLAEELSELLERHGLEWVERGQHANVSRWLAAVGGPPDERAEFNLLRGLIEARHDPEAGLAALDRAALLHHRAGRHDRELAAVHNMLIIAGNQGRQRQAGAALLRLLGLRRLLTSTETRGVAVLFGAMTAFLRGRYRIARRLAVRAAGYPFQPRERGALGIVQCQLATHAGAFAECVRLVDEILSDPAQRRHGPSYFTLRAARAFARGALDLERDQALAQIESAGEACDELRMPFTVASCAHTAARLLMASGRCAEATLRLERGLAIFEAHRDADACIEARALLAHAHWRLGDEERAAAQARLALEAFRHAEQRGRLRYRCWTAALATRVLAELGEVDEADRFARSHARSLELSELPICRHGAQIALARVASLAGDEGRALRHLERAVAVRESLDAPSPELDPDLLGWAAERARGSGARDLGEASPAARIAPLRIETLGGVRVWLDERPIDAARWRGHTARRLLLRLLCAEGRPIERERLSTELWPDAEPARARGNLRVALSRLRGVLEPEREAGEPEVWLELAGDAVALSSRALAAWDVRAFRESAHEVGRARANGEIRRATLRALALVEAHAGPFAPDVFDEWVLEMRARLEEELLALGRAAAADALAEDPGTACRIARKLVEVVPGDETAWILLVRGCLARGDRAGAARHGQRAVESLHRELLLEPSAELRALVAEARRAD